MSEDRTQAPTKRRRQQAREQGVVAYSPELTAAAGLLATLALLGLCGGTLGEALVEGFRTAFGAGAGPRIEPAAVAGLVRGTVRAVAPPLGVILGGTLAVMVLVHQFQVGGLWVPALLAPRPERLWAGGAGFGQGAGRSLWAVVKTAALIGLAAWLWHAHGAEVGQLAQADPPTLAVGSGRLLLRMAEPLAAALIVLGLTDFALRWRRLEAQLRLTPDEQKEELKAADGDPALRSRQRRQAESWRQDPAESLPGASLVVTAGRSLAVLLAGEGPPGRVAVRRIARGPAAGVLRRAAERAGLPATDAPPLALQLARGRGQALPPRLAEELDDLWPRPSSP